jgi:hypothetical protein
MSSFVVRRTPIWWSAIVLAAMFGVAVAIAIRGVPTWQNHGPDAGAGIVWHAAKPGMYYELTLIYACIAVVSLFLAFFRFPWVTITHIRLLFAAAFVALFAMLLYSLIGLSGEKHAEAAWQRIEELGGHGVWEREAVVVSFANAGVTDDDLKLFVDFPEVQMLDLSDNPVTDECLQHLENLESLHTLMVTGTSISPEAIANYESSHPNVEVRTTRSQQSRVNPFTGDPVD